MPVLNKYQDGSGYYIRARVEDGVITYQTTPKSDRLFNELGLTDGSSISWGMLRDLDERGDIYTGGSGADFSNNGDMSLDLSAENKRIYERYLSGESLFDQTNQINNVVNGFFTDRDDFHNTVRRSELANSIAERFIEESNPNLLTSLESFDSQPYEILNVTVEDSTILFEFSVSDSIELNCRDLRWSSKFGDFDGTVSYSESEAADYSFTIQDGYFIQWKSSAESSNHNQPVEDRHTRAYRVDYGKKSGLGFNEKNWTEVIRKCFLYVDRYDILPDERGGHRGLCSSSELPGKDIWVYPHSTNKSSAKGGPGQFVIINEIQDIRLPGINEIGWHFVRLDDQLTKSQGGNNILSGHPISLLTSDI